MPSKETGSIFIGKCPLCGDELVIGWLRNDAEIPRFDSKAKQRISVKDELNLGKDKQICTCGNCSAFFDTNKGRAVFNWTTDEPIVGNINLH
jgi:hypothetical protein